MELRQAAATGSGNSSMARTEHTSAGSLGEPWIAEDGAGVGAGSETSARISACDRMLWRSVCMDRCHVSWQCRLVLCGLNYDGWQMATCTRNGEVRCLAFKFGVWLDDDEALVACRIRPVGFCNLCTHVACTSWHTTCWHSARAWRNDQREQLHVCLPVGAVMPDRAH